MIKLLSLLLPVSLIGNGDFYLFPDQKENFFHRLGSEISRSHSHVTVITPTLSQKDLSKSLLKNARKGTHINLIVNDPKSNPLSIVQYANTELFIYTARKLEGSIILIDDHVACTLSGAIDNDLLVRNTVFAHCTADTASIRSIEQTVLKIRQRSRPYLK